MARTDRASVGGLCYHVYDRGNAQAVVFFDERDYDSFMALIARAVRRLPMSVLAYCLMPNHFHLVLRPDADGDLGRWMHWLLTSHVHRHRRRHDTVGRIWQGRFGSSPIQEYDHLLTALRYVERNPVRAELVPAVNDWPWSSIHERLGRQGNGLITDSPVQLPRNWLELVQQPLTAAELEAIRTCVRRDRPYGDDSWTRGTAERLGLVSSLNARGRPKSLRPREYRTEIALDYKN
jgi:putative transposase